MATRAELLEVVRERYGSARPAERRLILDEFVAVSGYHRKHAIRLLRQPGGSPAPDRRGRSPVYDAAVRAALVVVWEASDRICGKRLKAALPVLLPAIGRVPRRVPRQAPPHSTASGPGLAAGDRPSARVRARSAARIERGCRHAWCGAERKYGGDASAYGSDGRRWRVAHSPTGLTTAAAGDNDRSVATTNEATRTVRTSARVGLDTCRTRARRFGCLSAQ
jgi:hypothetical protein